MDDRKARLDALAAKAGRTKQIHATDESATTVPPENHDHPKLGAEAASSGGNGGGEPGAKRVKSDDTTSKNVLQKMLEEAKDEVPPLTLGVDNLIDIAPKKINFDLKRDIQPKLERLEKRTQKAIVELLRERIEEDAVNALYTLSRDSVEGA